MRLGRVADDACQEIEPHWRQRALPQVARRLALADEAPVLRRDRACIPAVGQVIDRAACNRIAVEDRPFDGGDAPVPRQQRRVIADAAQPRACKGLVADARMRVRGDDQVGSVRYRDSRNDLRILEHVHRYAGCLPRQRETVIGGGRHYLGDVDTVLRQRIEYERAEISRSDQRAFHESDRPFEFVDGRKNTPQSSQ